jgi:hypothetical protein
MTEWVLNVRGDVATDGHIRAYASRRDGRDIVLKRIG